MNAVAASALPDYNQIGAGFERYLPYIHPVTLAVLDHLPALPAGAKVLDVACGTGEPGLTLARRSLDIELLGVDAAPGMIAAARTKATREALPNVRFEVMPAETLALADGSTDAVISRFGLLMFGDAVAAARELARVLTAGGPFSLAVWDRMAGNTLVHSAVAAMDDFLPPELRVPVEHWEGLAAEGRREGVLRGAGLRTVETAMFSWTMEFPEFDAVWEYTTGPVFQRQFSALTQVEREQVHGRLTASLDIYRGSGGAYRLPHACRLLWGQR